MIIKLIDIIRGAVGEGKLFWFCEVRAKLKVLERAVGFFSCLVLTITLKNVATPQGGYDF